MSHNSALSLLPHSNRPNIPTFADRLTVRQSIPQGVNVTNLLLTSSPTLSCKQWPRDIGRYTLQVDRRYLCRATALLFCLTIFSCSRSHSIRWLGYREVGHLTLKLHMLITLLDQSIAKFDCLCEMLVWRSTCQSKARAFRG